MRTRKGLFSPEMDSIISRVYPQHGSRDCVEEIRETLGVEFDCEQIRGRTKRLGVSRAENYTRVTPQNIPGLPLWREYPVTVGAYKITGHLGYCKIGRGDRASHVYETECVNCGRTGQRLQVSIREAYVKGTTGCVHCAKHIRKATIKRESDHKAQMQIDMQNEHIQLMASMRVSSVPLTLSPEFDYYA